MMKYIIAIFCVAIGLPLMSQCNIKTIPNYTYAKTGILLDIDPNVQGGDVDTIINLAPSIYFMEEEIVDSQIVVRLDESPRYIDVDPRFPSDTLGLEIFPTDPPTSSFRSIRVVDNDYTIEFVFRLRPDAPVSNSYMGQRSQYQHYRILNDGPNSWRHTFTWDAASLRTVTSTTFNTSPTEWNHLIITYTAADLTLRYYVNGELKQTSIRPSTDRPTLYAGALFNGYKNSSNVLLPFYGDIGVLRLYQYKLTDKEIKQNFLTSDDLFDF